MAGLMDFLNASPASVPPMAAPRGSPVPRQIAQPVTVPDVLAHYVSPVANRMVNAGAENLSAGNTGVGLGQIIGGGLGQAAYIPGQMAADTVNAIGGLGQAVGHFAAHVGAGLMSDGTSVGPGGIGSDSAAAASQPQIPTQVASQPAAAAPAAAEGPIILKDSSGTSYALPQFSRAPPTAAEIAANAAANPPLPSNADLAAARAPTPASNPTLIEGGRVVSQPTSGAWTGTDGSGHVRVGNLWQPAARTPDEIAALRTVAPAGVSDKFLAQLPRGTAGILARTGMMQSQKGQELTNIGTQATNTGKASVVATIDKNIDALQAALLKNPNDANIRAQRDLALSEKAKANATMYFGNNGLMLGQSPALNPLGQ